MNTLSYFLSTLRPSPPPSPRASTSEFPIPLQVDGVTPIRPRELSSPSSVGDASDPSFDLLGAAEGHAGDRDEERGRTRRTNGTDALVRSDHRGEPPRIGIVPPSRKGSRKGKSRAEHGVASGHGHEQDALDEKSSREPTLPFHDKQPTTATATTQSVTLSTDPRPTSWPFVARLARTWPFRFTASLYLLIRRFLSLFGLSYPPRPHFNSLLSPLVETESDREKSGPLVKSTIVSLALTSTASAPESPPSFSDTPPPSVPPSPGFPSSQSTTVPRPLRAPPRLTPKTLVLDLDETLIHSTSRPTSFSGGRGARRSVPKGLKTTMVEVVLDGRSTMYTVYKRPWVDFFLRKVSSWYTVIIFTASLPEYADPVIDWLDGGDGRGGLIGGRLFRKHCLAKNGTYVKDLTVVDQDLAKVCLVDNSPVSYAINQANGIPIEGWINDPNDECLLDLLPMLDSLRFTNDVRRVLGLRGFGKSSSSLPAPAGNPPAGTRRATGTPANLAMTPSLQGRSTGAGSTVASGR
ncbi:hypothetical protein JCM11491_002586 [Sporobolomyces phaffii]